MRAAEWDHEGREFMTETPFDSRGSVCDLATECGGQAIVSEAEQKRIVSGDLGNDSITIPGARATATAAHPLAGP